MALIMQEYGKFKNGETSFYGPLEDVSAHISIKRSDNIAPDGYALIIYKNSKPDVPENYKLNYKFVKEVDHITKEYCLIKNDDYLDGVFVKDYENAVQDHLNAKVQERGYDDVYTCLSYKDDPFPKFRDEAAAVLAWRSSVWLTAQNILNKWQNGEIEQPTIQEVIDQLPELKW